MEEFVTELESARRRAVAAEQTLEFLQSAVRRMTKQTKQALTQLSSQRYKMSGDMIESLDGEMNNGATAHTDEPMPTSLDDWSIGDLLVTDMSNEFNTDFMDLYNTIRMLQEHLRLSSAEASEAQSAQVDSEAWKERALSAELYSQSLVMENQQFASRLEQLSWERRLLIRECRRARKVAADAEENSLAKELQLQTVEALVIHEQQLASGKLTTIGSSKNSDHSQNEPTEGSATNPRVSFLVEQDTVKKNGMLENTCSDTKESQFKISFAAGLNMSSYVPLFGNSLQVDGSQRTNAKANTVVDQSHLLQRVLDATSAQCGENAAFLISDPSQENFLSTERGFLSDSSTKPPSIKFCPPGLVSARLGRSCQYR